MHRSGRTDRDDPPVDRGRRRVARRPAPGPHHGWACNLALGLGTLRALAVDDAEARPWVALAGMADAVDALVTVLAFHGCPASTRWGILASTAGAAVVSFRVALALEPDQPPATEPLSPWPRPTRWPDPGPARAPAGPGTCWPEPTGPRGRRGWGQVPR